MMEMKKMTRDEKKQKRIRQLKIINIVFSNRSRRLYFNRKKQRE